MLLFPKQLRKQLGRDSTYAGTTCVVVLAFGNELWVGNAGDSRAVVCAVDPTNDDFVVRPNPLVCGLRIAAMKRNLGSNFFS